ncbi:MAG: hypothetical protein ACTSP1_16255 [Candidatus Freyarchaeota archaeon]
MEDFLNLLPTSQAITSRIRREKLEDIRRAVMQLFTNQWEKHGRKAAKREVDIILDRTKKQVWPKTKKKRRKENMKKWMMMEGREKHLCLATLMATDGNLNLFLKIDPVTPLKNSPLDEVKRDLDYTLKLNIKARLRAPRPRIRKQKDTHTPSRKYQKRENRGIRPARSQNPHRKKENTGSRIQRAGNPHRTMGRQTLLPGG